ncbi:DUF6545 domain-containing protein [Rhodococcus erythropolis]|uniref:DUF6545 domain-containing protein n=1 Tax=Rhodococcus erythropolis TaxID=1833 RepID=UPI002948C52A|nr:DUF6545 domain-containing protein [Rhodococcus erythropolis]MDV6278097.1 DUF6545 domain-containing protein [Rhodococcus erythropolis]
MPEWIDQARLALMVMVICALGLRAPAIRDPRQRPIWVVLVPLAAGAIAIQLLRDDLAASLNEVVGIDEFNELLVGVVALCDFAAVWWFAVRLHRSARPTPRWLVRAPVASALVTAPMLIGYFAISPGELRFGEQARSWWLGYAVTWTIYAALTAVGALVLLCLAARTIESTVLRVSVLLMAAGTAAELPYLITRNIRWFTHAPPSMPAWSFGFSFTRFALVALGACLAATWPILRGIGDHLRYRRLTPLWTLLTAATPELRVCPPAPARLADIAAADLGWELLHQRMIDIHDSLLALHARATAELVDRAHTYADTHARARRRTATALGYLTAHVLTEAPGPSADAAQAPPLTPRDPLTAPELLALQRTLLRIRRDTHGVTSTAVPSEITAARARTPDAT